MSHVFISYKTEERDQAQQVRTALALAAKCDVWWDQDLQTGGAWSTALDDAARDAACIVVLWSARSIASPWVQQEAAVAKAMGKLVPARIDDCALPEPYRSIQTANLCGWNGREDHPEFAKLVRGVRSCLDANLRKRWPPKRLIGPVAFGLCAVAGFAAGFTVRAELGSTPSTSQDLGRAVAPSFDDYLARRRIEHQHGAQPEMFLRGELAELQERTLTLHLPAGACRSYLAVVEPDQECGISWWSNGPGARQVVVTESGTPNVKIGRICTVEERGMSATVGLTIKMLRGSGAYALETYFESQLMWDHEGPGTPTDATAAQ